MNAALAIMGAVSWPLVVIVIGLFILIAVLAIVRAISRASKRESDILREDKRASRALAVVPTSQREWKDD